MAFGTRRIDPTEHQDGLILAISVESVVKLIAFLAVGVFVVWGLFGGLEGLMSVAASDPRIAEVMRAPPNPINWLTVTLLSGLAILLLPRQFHVSVVESRDARDIARARWLFPGYLILINLFVAPLAIAGIATFGDGAIDRDLTVLALPLNAGAHLLALTTMLGGLSAATTAWWWSTASRWRSPSPTISSCRSCWGAARRSTISRRPVRSAHGC